MGSASSAAATVPSTKIRHIEFHPDEYLAGVAGMKPVLRAIYDQVWAMIYSKGRALIEADELETIAAICRVSKRVCQRTLEELVRVGKLVRKAGGLLSHQRCEDELERARQRAINAKLNGKKGGRPRKNRSSNAENSHGDEANPMAMQGAEKPRGFDSAKANHKPQTTNQISEESSYEASSECTRDETPVGLGGQEVREQRRRQTERELTGEFESQFWPRYPHKTGKPKAFIAFKHARRKSSLPEIISGLDRYIAGKPLDRQWLNPATFLNQERWADQPAMLLPIAGGRNDRREHPYDIADRNIREAIARGEFDDEDGAAGDPAITVEPLPADDDGYPDLEGDRGEDPRVAYRA